MTVKNVTKSKSRRRKAQERQHKHSRLGGGRSRLTPQQAETIGPLVQGLQNAGWRVQD